MENIYVLQDCCKAILSRRTRILIVQCILLSTLLVTGFAQESRIARQIAEQSHRFDALPSTTILTTLQASTAHTRAADRVVHNAIYAGIVPQVLDDIFMTRPEFLVLTLPAGTDKSWKLRLQRAMIFTETFQVFTATGGDTPYPFVPGVYYWGVVEGITPSLVALSITQDEISGFIQAGEVNYTLGKLEHDPDNTHILYATDDLEWDPGITCHVEDEHHIKDGPSGTGGQRSQSNCVKMYIQVDYDIVVGKGGVQQATDYVSGVFSQVAIMYANEQVELVVNEMFVWNTTDPFTGPSTSNYLTQFRNYLNGNYNGDLAHLVGYNGGGGIAYLNVLCNSYYGVAYSAINSSYQNVPTYSWTVMVLTHEIGHNLGSQHTHACAWNGNNTAIDGCGPAAGYSEGCNGPIPASGTIMSYCHLIGGVGINFNNGFGPQPGDRIRTRISNATCLESCGEGIQYDAGITAISTPITYPCEASTSPVVTLSNFGQVTLTSVTIRSQTDNGTIQNFVWTGSLAQGQTTQVTLPSISYNAGAHTFRAFTFNPNGQADENNSNNETSKAFTYYVDWCTCNAATAQLTPNPLTHTGSGSSSATVTFAPDSKRPEFTITGLDARQSGAPQTRYIDVVTVTYVDYFGVTKTYGTFSGSQQSTVNVSIQDMTNSVSVSLTNGLGSGFTGTLSVSFTTVNYCDGGSGCIDTDDDGVCDEDDGCPTDPNKTDPGICGCGNPEPGTPCDDGDECTENDIYSIDCVCVGTPIPGCPPEGCPEETTSHFTPNPLTHLGTGQSFATVSLSINHADPSFVLSNLDARLNGNPNQRYIDRVTVSYVNGSGNTVTYGTFRGDQVSTVNVSISGVVQSIALALDDAYDGNSSPTVLSVSMSPVTSCHLGAALEGRGIPGNTVFVYPNPSSQEIFIRFDRIPGLATVYLYNTLGVLVGTTQVSDVAVTRISLDSYRIRGNQMLFVMVDIDGERSVFPVMVLVD